LALAVVPLHACDARDVDIGAEQACQPDPRLSQALDSTPQVGRISRCLVIGDNALQNADFETPLLADTCTPGMWCQFPMEDTQWGTSSPFGVVELWPSGHEGVPSPQGAQHAEVNAEHPDTLFQEVALVPGSVAYWSLFHRGRRTTEPLEVRLGNPPSLQATLISEFGEWKSASGLYRVPSGESVTRLELASLSEGSFGNLIDAVVLASTE
jgi:hypothetical protein